MQKGNIVRSLAGFVLRQTRREKMWYILLVVCLEYIFSASCLRERGAFTGHLEMMTLLEYVCMYRKDGLGMGGGFED